MLLVGQAMRNLLVILNTMAIQIANYDRQFCNRWAAYTCFGLLSLILATGCQSPAFRAGKLPAKYRSAARGDRQSIDFSKVASSGPSDAVIAPSDLLDITVATGREDENVEPIAARVAEDGTVLVPIIGPVPVAGLEALEASQNISKLAIERGMYRNPLITVEIKTKAVNHITVLGAVKEPGLHELPRGSSDLVSAIAAAGGLNEEAGTEVEIVRQPSTVLADNSFAQPENVQLASHQSSGGQVRHIPATTLNLDLSKTSGSNYGEVKLSDRDVVRIVPRKKETIYVSGLVKEPGMFELPVEQDIHLLDAIALAGGQSSDVADKVFVIRRVESQAEPIVIQASISAAKKNGLENLRLAAGDTITIEQTPATAIVDSLKHFFRLSLGVASNTAF